MAGSAYDIQYSLMQSLTTSARYRDSKASNLMVRSTPSRAANDVALSGRPMSSPDV